MIRLRTVLYSEEGGVRTEIDVWYAPELDGVLRAHRWTNRSIEGRTPIDVFAQLELREHRVNGSVPPVRLAPRDADAPVVPDLAIGFLPDPVNVSSPNATQRFWLVDLATRARWRPDPNTTGIEWHLVERFVAHRHPSGEPEVQFTFGEPGPYSILVRLFPKECILQPFPTRVNPLGDLARLGALVPTYWEKSWEVNVGPGTARDFVLDELTVTSGGARVIAFTERVGMTAGSAFDDGRLVLRTPANNDLSVPYEALPEGLYRVVWRAQGPGGGAILGDDWRVTLRLQYFG